MQLTSQPAREALGGLLAVARERGLSTTLLEDVLGEAGLRALNLANPAGALRAVRDYGQGNSTRATGAPELVELFVLREPATRARWQELIGTDLTRRAIDARLIASLPGSADELQLRVDIRPYSFPHLFGDADSDASSLGGEFLLASDPDAGLWPQEPTPDDHVPGLGNAPRSLLRAIPPADNPWLPSPQRILDLGCGGGALSLALQLAYPEAHVVGTDISGRALDFAAINGTQLH